MKLAGMRNETSLKIAPYLSWMALMLLLPGTAWAYGLRACVAGLFLAAFFAWGRRLPRPSPKAVASGVVAGLFVLFLWVWPERFELYRKLFILGQKAAESSNSPYNPAVCGWALTIAKLIGSAFIIAPAEELFFRSFLYRWIQGAADNEAFGRRFDASAFFWTVALFALEHDRWLAGAMAGAIYGILAIRTGLASAIIAHATTNLALGAYVIMRGEWAFW
ncbi:MAG: CAAX prenyl protease-related protein [Kiritimatiellae bacterium]|nr:CAAX prenyl protease-related protein [Kiritimatiellia bacterium]